MVLILAFLGNYHRSKTLLSNPLYNLLVPTNLDAIYLYKPPETESETHTWTYYRVRGDFAAGGTLQVARVSWPSLQDRKDGNLVEIIDTPGIVGYVTDHLQTLLREQWGVRHDDSTLIGFIPA